MNSWRAVGYIFTGFGVLFLIIGLFVGIGASYLVYQISPQLGQTLLIAGFLFPWGIIASFMFVVGFVGLYAGQTRQTASQRSPVYEQPYQHVSNPPDNYQANPPPPREAICPSCGKNIIFIQQCERWYCPNEKKYI